MSQVHDDVIPLFEDAADILIDSFGKDPKKALCASLAYLSGHYKNVLENRSLLTGQDKCVTFELKANTPFYNVSGILNVLKKYAPDNITSQIRGMRTFKDMKGAVFDISD